MCGGEMDKKQTTKLEMFTKIFEKIDKKREENYTGRKEHHGNTCIS